VTFTKSPGIANTGCAWLALITVGAAGVGVAKAPAGKMIPTSAIATIAAVARLLLIEDIASEWLQTSLCRKAKVTLAIETR